jgi:LysM repeat protein
MQKSQFPIIATVVIMAIIAAVGLFLAVSYIQRRPDLAQNQFTRTVEGTQVTVNIDPAQEVQIVSPPAQPAATSNTPEAAATVTPEPAPTDTPVPTPEPTATLPPPFIFIDYVVQPNETMYSVTLRQVTSITLMAQEGIAQDDLIPGTTIKLPIGNPAYCPGRKPYAVGEDDTVYNISRQSGVSIEELKKINHLGDDFKILAGQILCIP